MNGLSTEDVKRVGTVVQAAWFAIASCGRFIATGSTISTENLNATAWQAKVVSDKVEEILLS